MNNKRVFRNRARWRVSMLDREVLPGSVVSRTLSDPKLDSLYCGFVYHEVEPMAYLCPHRRPYVLHSPMSYSTISNFSGKNRSLILLMALEGMGTGL